MENYSQLAERLAESLNLRQPPVAVCFADAVPASVPAHEGHAPAGCRFWEDAAAGAFATSSSDHALCAIGVYTHNLEPSPAQQTDIMDALKVFGDLGYVTPQDLPQIPVLKTRPAPPNLCAARRFAAASRRGVAVCGRAPDVDSV